ncbi:MULTISPECIES: tRNA-dihydrouridine synthase [unclassified Mesotoga]|uniref:tRNA dihydrouridine synthase n=1 Tax=unclassified Mesotoga TaxID=1184398 RepID=UPI000DA6DB0D|nr:MULTISPECIES: tRNA-dihydrouridine synthase [unclassified Mesotoga]PZC52547.1 dihydrouridine synthase [Mesotoga sp. TolDC]
MDKQIGLSPMAGYTDATMRELSVEWGADFVFSEMISAEGALRSSGKTDEIVPSTPTRIQLFGSNVSRMAKAAAKLSNVATWIDINAGCPVRKVTRRGAGSALLKTPEKIAEMIIALKNTVEVPVSVKIRLGFDCIEREKIIYPIMKAKPEAVFVHGRTVAQAYSGSANWEEIDRIARLLHGEGILSYGSGDMFSPEAIVNALRRYSVDGVVVARGAIGNPWIFRQAKDLIKFGSYDELTLQERLGHFLRHFTRLSEAVGEDQAVRDLRKSFAGYTRNIRHAARLRNEYMKCNSFCEVKELLEDLIPDYKTWV